VIAEADKQVMKGWKGVGRFNYLWYISIKTFYSDFQKDFCQQRIQRLKDTNCSEVDTSV